ncbi:MAG TPA: hypothetical protein VK488_05690 [Gaiellaceae bacterium]|nr:hypothetical protein [Gaiellaceae bacterium]
MKSIPAAIVAAAAIALSAGSAPAAHSACPYQGQVFIYGQNGWETLTNALAANQTPCVQYYIVLTAISDKTVPRGRRAIDFVHAKGGNFHALAEFNWAHWSKVTGSWYSKGVKFRRRMAAAGYNPALGDSWAVNELSSATRSLPAARTKVRDALRGLFTGPRGSPPQMGAVFTIGMTQRLRNFGPYKSQVESWLADAAFWTAVTPYVAWWGQEAYPSCSLVCVATAKVAVRSSHVNDFVEHPAKLASAGPAATVAVRNLFDRSYFPVMTAYWNDPKGYGNNRISRDAMQKLVSLEVYAARAWAGRNPYPDGRIGFAWNEHPAGATPADVQSLATRLARAIQAAYGDGGTAGKACSPTGAYTLCKAAVQGAAFNERWKTFETW